MSWTKIDPRNWSTSHPRCTVAVLGLVTCVMLYGNLIVERGGVLDDGAILDQSNPYRQSNLYVRGKQRDGFHGGESLLFLLRFPEGIQSKEDLRRVRSLTEDLKEEFGPSVLSLSEVSEYEDTGDELLVREYVPEHFAENFELDAWKRRVRADPSVFGTLVGRDFQWSAVLRYVEDGARVSEYRHTVEFLEERTIPGWEWLFKTSIELPDGLGVAGGEIMRGLFDQGLKIDNATLVAIGVGLAFPLFICFLGSVRQALLGVLGVVALGFLWTRGSVGLVQVAGFEIRERLFTLLAYTNCIVQGVSFVLHKFEAYNELRDATGCPEEISDRWKQARGNDHLIAATGAIAILGFGTLYSFQVLPIRELGIVSAIGVVWLMALSLVFLPALHIVTSSHATERRPGARMRFAGALLDRLEWVVSVCSRLVTRSSGRRTAWVAGLSTFCLVTLTTVLIWPGDLLTVKMVYSDLLRGTVVKPTQQFLDAPGRMGSDAVYLLVEPSNGGDIYDPEFLASVSRYQDSLRHLPRVREVGSLANFVRRVSEESLKKPLPQTRQESRAVFGLIESHLNRAIAREMYYSGGIRLTVQFVGGDSVTMGRIFEQALQLAESDHPGLRVSPFGKDSLYPQLDRYIRIGKPVNVLSSQLVIIAICWFGLWFNNRRLGGNLRLSAPIGSFFMSVAFLFASAVIMVVMIAARVPLEMATASIAALAINASVDFAIYYTDSYQRGLSRFGEHRAAVRFAMATKGRIVLEDMILNAVCFMPLLLSRFETIRDVGWIMVVMLVACAFGTVVVMPALFYAGLRSTKPEHASVLWGHRGPEGARSK